MSPRFHRAILAGLALALAHCVVLSTRPALAQGTVELYNHISQSVITHVYLGGDHQIAGNGPSDYPPGGQDWTGFTGLLGTGYTAQLWAANGADQPDSALQPVAPTTTFITATLGAGTLNAVAIVNVPGVPEGGIATMSLRVWDNLGGTITSWAMAQASGAASGRSPLFNSQPLGAPTGDFAALLVGLVSFNIYQVPEPCALGLLGLGAFLLWLARAKKAA